MLWISSETVDVSPRSSVHLGCGTGAKVEADNAIDGLEANIIVVRSHDRTSKLLIVSVDTLFLGPFVSNAITKGLKGIFGPDEIFLAATHTHNAPMIDESKPKLGEKNLSYTTFLISGIIEASIRLSKSPERLVSTRAWTAAVSGVVSRRNIRLFDLSRSGVRFGQVLQRPNFMHPKKVEATLLEFVTEGNELLATLAVLPCHPVAYMGVDAISADLVGELRRQYRLQTTNEMRTPFIFLQGASGDLNPWWRAHWLTGGLVSMINQLVNGPLFPVFTLKELEKWSRRRVWELLSAKSFRSKAIDLRQSGNVGSSLITLPLSVFLESAHNLSERMVSIHRLSIEDLRFVGISAEVTSSFLKEVDSILRDQVLVTCISDSFGYITSSSEYVQGGYEVDGHQNAFSISHLASKTPGSVLKENLRNHASEA